MYSGLIPVVLDDGLDDVRLRLKQQRPIFHLIFIMRCREYARRIGPTHSFATSYFG